MRPYKMECASLANAAQYNTDSSSCAAQRAETTEHDARFERGACILFRLFRCESASTARASAVKVATTATTTMTMRGALLHFAPFLRRQCNFIHATRGLSISFVKCKQLGRFNRNASLSFSFEPEDLNDVVTRKITGAELSLRCGRYLMQIELRAQTLRHPVLSSRHSLLRTRPSTQHSADHSHESNLHNFANDN